MPYVAPEYYSTIEDADEPIESSYTTLEALEALADDAADDGEAVQRGIEADIARVLQQNAGSRTGKVMDGAAQQEATLQGGMHVWAGTKMALAATFPGWPGPNQEWDAFKMAVMPFLRQAKQGKAAGQAPDVDAFFIRYPAAAATFQRFISNAPIYQRAAQQKRFHYALLRIMVRGVKYVSAEKRQKYLVNIGAMITRNGAPFDTKELCERKRTNNMRGTAGGTVVGDAKALRCIWVMTAKGAAEFEFYSHFGKLGRFHHSSLAAGSPVAAAGEWFVERGSCTLINACSGHYRPEPWRFVNALRVLNNAGAVDAGTEVQMWKANDGVEVRMPLLQFINGTARALSTHNLFPPH